MTRTILLYADSIIITRLFSANPVIILPAISDSLEKVFGQKKDTDRLSLTAGRSVFIYPTDTCYGIGCSVFDEEALKRVYEIKGRNSNKPVNIMVDSVEMFARFGEITPLTEKLIKAFLPGDLTLLVKRITPSPLKQVQGRLLRGASPGKHILSSNVNKKYSEEKDKIKPFLGEGGRRPEGVSSLPAFINSSQSFIGIRIPKNDFCMQLLRIFNTPIVTTSANIAGEPETYSLPDIQKAFGKEHPNINYIFDGGVLAKNPPSTIIQIEGDTWNIIRQGRVTEEMIREIM